MGVAFWWKDDATATSAWRPHQPTSPPVRRFPIVAMLDLPRAPHGFTHPTRVYATHTREELRADPRSCGRLDSDPAAQDAREASGVEHELRAVEP